MVPGELQQIVSDALGIPFPTVSIHARRLREAGAITRAGRGKSAPSMGVADAARLLVSLLWSTGVNDAVPALERAASARLMPDMRIGFLARPGDDEAGAVELMTWLLEAYASGAVADYHARHGGHASTLGSSVRLSFRLNGKRSFMVEYVPVAKGGHPERCAMMIPGDTSPALDYQSVNRVSGKSLMVVAGRFAG